MGEGKESKTKASWLLIKSFDNKSSWERELRSSWKRKFGFVGGFKLYPTLPKLSISEIAVFKRTRVVFLPPLLSGRSPEPYQVGCREKLSCVFKFPHEIYESEIKLQWVNLKENRRERRMGVGRGTQRRKGTSGGGCQGESSTLASLSCWSFGV